MGGGGLLKTIFYLFYLLVDPYIYLLFLSVDKFSNPTKHPFSSIMERHDLMAAAVDTIEKRDFEFAIAVMTSASSSLLNLPSR